ncbi:hypothetical protein DFH27DRAFT_82934 [Peziza echinospora]|nr:hypothetical protein DFH27DRAFT_82934 [Peziza echinospora]
MTAGSPTTAGKMMTTVTIILLAFFLPYIVHAGRKRITFGNRTELKRSVSAPTIPTARANEVRPKAKRRATEGTIDGPSLIAAEGIVAEPDEDEGMLSDNSMESYVRFGRGMTFVDEKIGGGLVKSAVDHDLSTSLASERSAGRARH